MFQLPSCFCVKHKILKQWLLIAGVLSTTLPVGFVPTVSHAANLGRINAISTVNQPLQAEIELNGVDPKDLGKVKAKLADDDAYNNHGYKNPNLKDVELSVKTKPNGKPYIDVKSSTPVNKESLDLMFDVQGTDGTTQTRDYRVVLDPEEKPSNDLGNLALSNAKRNAIKRQKLNQKASKNVRVREGDTLGKIANRVKPKNLSVDQMLVMLYNANPKAFWGNNMNNLKSGVILKVPKGNVPSRGNASNQVELHASNWNGYRSKLAKAVETDKHSSAPKESATSGTITPKVNDANKQPNGDVLKLSSDDKNAKARLQMLEEEATIREKALKESNDRVDSLEKQISDMKKLATIQNPGMANAQNQAEKAIEKKTPPKTVEHKVVLEPKAEQKKAENPPAEEGDFWSNPLYLIGILVGILGVGGFILFLRKKRAEREEEERQNRLERMSGANRPQEPEKAPDPTPISPAFEQKLVEATQKQPELDILEQVDLLRRDGKDKEAEDLLERELAKTPYRNELHLKLLEIYADRRDTDSFEKEARSLKNLIGNDNHSDWQKAKTMGRGIDPFNPLYLDDQNKPEESTQEKEVIEKLESTQEIPGDFVDFDNMDDSLNDIPDLSQQEEPETPKVEEPKPEPKKEDDFNIDTDEALELPDDDLMLTSELNAGSLNLPDESLEDSSDNYGGLDSLLAGKDVGDDNIDNSLEALENDGIDIPQLDDLGIVDETPKKVSFEKKDDSEELFNSDSTPELDAILDTDTIDAHRIPLSADEWGSLTSQSESKDEFKLEGLNDNSSSSKPEKATSTIEIEQNMHLDNLDALDFDSIEKENDDLPTVSSLNKDSNKKDNELPDLDFGDDALDLNSTPKASPQDLSPANPILDMGGTDNLGSLQDELELAKNYISFGGVDDLQNAKDILNNIINSGDAKLKAEAEELLKSFK